MDETPAFKKNVETGATPGDVVEHRGAAAGIDPAIDELSQRFCVRARGARPGRAARAHRGSPVL